MKKFFAKIRAALMRMMYGRNGYDGICGVLMWVYLALLIGFYVSAAMEWLIAYLVLSVLMIVVLFYLFFRIFSRNVQKRRREVDRFFRPFRLMKNRFRDRKTHVYKKCPSCRATLRLPKKKGEHTVRCPGCGNRFNVKI